MKLREYFQIGIYALIVTSVVVSIMSNYPKLSMFLIIVAMLAAAVVVWDFM